VAKDSVAPKHIWQKRHEQGQAGKFIVQALSCKKKRGEGKG
jgi:hypothetical protein